MAAPSPVRRAQPGAVRRPSLRLVRGVAQRRRRRGRTLTVAAVVIMVGSPLATAGAQAYLAQGQVRLTALQQQLATAVTRHRVLEQKVAQLEDPTTIIGRAQQLGLVAPAQIGDLAEVPLDQPLPTTAPTASVPSPASPSTTVVDPVPAGTSTSAGSGQ